MPKYGRQENYHLVFSKFNHTSEKYEKAVVYKQGRTNIYCELSGPKEVIHIVHEKHMELYLKVRTQVPAITILVERQYEMNTKLVEEGFFLT